MCLCVYVCVTCDNGGHAPADGVVEPHGTIVNVALLGLHAVDMKALHEHPSKRGHEEVMQENGDDCAKELKGKRKRIIKGRKEKEARERLQKEYKGMRGEAGRKQRKDR